MALFQIFFGTKGGRVILGAIITAIGLFILARVRGRYAEGLIMTLVGAILCLAALLPNF